MINGHDRGWYGENAQMAIDTLAMRPTKGIPHWAAHVMDIPLMEELAGVQPGDYSQNPTDVYLKMQWNVGTCFIDQFIPDNALSMGQHGYEGKAGQSATTGKVDIVVDGMLIDSPEAVVEHMETRVFPWLENNVKSGDASKEHAWIASIIKPEHETQDLFGPSMLKPRYGTEFPRMRYYTYGYENYFMAYALYPEVIERDFRLQADQMVYRNQVLAQAFLQGGLPMVMRLDHDMADSRGTLVNIKTLDDLWFPHFQRAIQPLLDAGIRCIWHCDGNLMEMVPRLLECGLGGFQGFQYEDGMDYEKICAMTDRNGDPLLIWAGCSVTTTLPHGTKQDVIKEVKWLVEKGPKVGLVLGGSSSVAPSTNHENIKTWIEAMNYYRKHGRG